MEAIRMANFDSDNRNSSENERKEIKIDIVNPIPASIATPNKVLQLEPVGL